MDRGKTLAYGRPAAMVAAAIFGLWTAEKQGLGEFQGLILASFLAIAAMAAVEMISYRFS